MHSCSHFSLTSTAPCSSAFEILYVLAWTSSSVVTKCVICSTPEINEVFVSFHKKICFRPLDAFYRQLHDPHSHTTCASLRATYGRGNHMRKDAAIVFNQLWNLTRRCTQATCHSDHQTSQSHAYTECPWADLQYQLGWGWWCWQVAAAEETDLKSRFPRRSPSFSLIFHFSCLLSELKRNIMGYQLLYYNLSS